MPDGCFAATSVAAFFTDGLRHGESAAAITTPERWAEILRACDQAGIDAQAHLAADKLITVDAEGALGVLLRDRHPVPALFDLAVGAPLTALCGGGRRLRIYVDMVDLLWRRGESAAALALEDLWNRLLARLPARLLCGYSVESFDGDEDGSGFSGICARHDRVQPVEGFDQLPVTRATDPSRLMAELQVSASHAKASARGRQQAEDRERRARRQLEAAHERLSHLQKVTAALSEAVTADDIGRVVIETLATAVGAQRATLFVPHGPRALRMMAQAGLEPESEARFATLPTDAPLPPVDSFGTGRASWFESLPELLERYPNLEGVGPAKAVAGLPLEVGGRRLGVLGFGFVNERSFSPMDRALHLDVARQVGCALDRARLYEAARASEARLLEASRRKDEFLALLGHELRNPLAPIVSSLEVLKLKLEAAGGCWPELGVLERQVTHVTRLVDDLLDVSRITEGKLEMKKATVELDDVLARALELAAPLIEQRGQQLSVETAPGTLQIDADAVRLAQAVGNLLGNAAKYTPEGGRIVLRSRRCAGDAVVEVVDSGAGIAADLLQTIFEPFVQVKRTVESAQGGLGLGLALVKSVVELHGGSVDAESDGPGLGSVFRIRVPARPQVAEPADSPAGACDVPLGAPSTGRRVLIVDDNRDAADSLGAMLRLVGHATQVAYSGADALAHARGADFDVALLDLDLPDMDGYEIARRLRELRNGMPRRFVAITGFGTAEDRERSLAAGFLDHLVKPIDHERLLALLDSPAD